MGGWRRNLILLAAWLPIVAGAEVKVLFDFVEEFDGSAGQANALRGARIGDSEDGAGGLRVQTHTYDEFPAVEFLPERERWDLSPFAWVSVGLRNTGTTRVRVKGRCVDANTPRLFNWRARHVDLDPGERKRLSIPIERRPGGLVGLYGYPGGILELNAVDPEAVERVLLWVIRPSERHEFVVEDIRAGGQRRCPSIRIAEQSGKPFLPIIDRFGQYIHEEWPTKIDSVDEMMSAHEAELEQIREEPRPTGFNRYGGYEGGPQLEATGFFRTEKVDGTWWLVDPEGRLFFSHGVCAVRTREYTVVEEREHLFEWLPDRDAEFAECYVQSGELGRIVFGRYEGRDMLCFSFHKANLIRKYGARDWLREFERMSVLRLRSWGMNTIGAFPPPAPEFYHEEGNRIPYVRVIWSGSAARLRGSEGVWTRFPDPFDPSFREAIEDGMRSMAEREIDDPYCIGFFVDNELDFGNETYLARATLQSPARQGAKQVFMQDLQEKYGTIDALNRAWETRYACWDDFLDAREQPGRSALPDLRAFNQKVVSSYYKQAREAVKALAPNQLYLGSRFAARWNEQTIAAAAEFCDVVTINLYDYTLAYIDENLPEQIDVPILIGEFNFGAYDRGHFFGGTKPVPTQERRARQYIQYVEEALRHPNIVGTHWFKYVDYAVSGKFQDGTNLQNGLVDSADQPYVETVDAVRQIGRSMYPIRLGKDE